MARDLILAIDQGTTGTTALLVDSNFRPLARKTVDFPQHFPQPGWVEHEPEEIWASVLMAISHVLDDESRNRLAAIGITNQRETCLVWHRTSGKVLSPAIVWQDRRTAEFCEKLQREGHEPQIRERTGLCLDPYFSGTKLAWILDHFDADRRQAESGEWAAGTIDSYLIWRLSGKRSHVSDPTNASRTLLWPLEGRANGAGWDPELAKLFGVPLQLLPTVVPNAGICAQTLGVPGLPDGIAIAGLAGDQHAALFGQGCFDAGMAKCTYGTGAFVLMQTGNVLQRSKHGLLTTVAWQLGDRVDYALEGSAFMAGAVVSWLRDELGLIAHVDEIEALARSVADSDGVVLVPAHAGLGAPHWRPHARGLISGLTRGTNKAHLARAALEGIALQVGDLITAMAQDMGGKVREVRVDGGAASNDLLMQIQADILGVPLARSSMLETTALGAAMFAALGIGLCPSLDALRPVWRLERSFEPEAGRYEAAFFERWRDALRKC
jgi:glycerol kinase